MPKMTGTAAMHVMLLRISKARDAYEVFGWTAATVFTFAEMQARWDEFHEVMHHEFDLVWRRQPAAVRAAFQAVFLGALRR